MTATRMSDEALDTAMAELRGKLPARGLSVRATEKWAHNQRCNTNNAMYAARVDADDLLHKTDLAVDFGLSPFAIQRGNRVEQIGRANGYAVTIDLLRTNFGFGIDKVVPLDLRHGFPKNEQGMIARAQRTRQAIEANILGRPGAPNIIEGATALGRSRSGFSASVHLSFDHLAVNVAFDGAGAVGDGEPGGDRGPVKPSNQIAWSGVGACDLARTSRARLPRELARR